MPRRDSLASPHRAEPCHASPAMPRPDGLTAPYPTPPHLTVTCPTVPRRNVRHRLRGNPDGRPADQSGSRPSRVEPKRPLQRGWPFARHAQRPRKRNRRSSPILNQPRRGCIRPTRGNFPFDRRHPRRRPRRQIKIIGTGPGLAWRGSTRRDFGLAGPKQAEWLRQPFRLFF